MSESTDLQMLFKNYAEEAGRYLPRRKREDIQLEIYTMLEDALEDKSCQLGKPADEEMALEMLREFGPPINFAAAYRKDDYLIGPRMFPFFKWVSVLVLGLYTLQFLIGLGLSIGEGALALGDLLENGLGGLFETIGSLVFAFAILERTIPDSWHVWPFTEFAKTWNPAELKGDKLRERVKPGELWVESIFLIGMILLFAVFPHYVGYGRSIVGEWDFVPVLAPAFSVYVPWLVLYYLCRLVFNVFAVRQFYWDSRLRWSDVVLRIFGIVLLAAMISGPSIIGLNPAYVTRNPVSESAQAAFLNSLPEWQSGIQILLIFMLIMNIVGMVRPLLKALRSMGYTWDKSYLRE